MNIPETLRVDTHCCTDPATFPRMRPQLASLIYLANAIDLKRDKLDQAMTVARREQIGSQLEALLARFQEQYQESIGAIDHPLESREKAA
jgi:hypothetical protein